MPINFSSKNTYIKKIIIKENENHYFFIGTTNIPQNLHYLKIRKLKFNEQKYDKYSKYKLKDILEEKEIKIKNYTDNQLEQKLNAKNVPLKAVKDIGGIFGFIKFNMSYYALLACDCNEIGKIGRDIIYRVNRLIYFPLFTVEENFFQSLEYIKEEKYLTLVRSFDYNKQLYFSYSYDLTKTLQRNFVEHFKREMVSDFEKKAYCCDNKNRKKEQDNKIINVDENENNTKSNDNSQTYKINNSGDDNENDFENINVQINENEIKYSLKKYTNYYFCWNYFHIKEFFVLLKNKIWINFYIYGFFSQVECNIYGLRLLISVIARRNRHYAGSRYLKRGVSDDGNVANDVETEQILEEISSTWTDRPIISSFIHIRGSIPIYWFQEQNSLFQKPVLNVNLTDLQFEATKRHFASLLERYGHPCIVCNLTKKTEVGKKQETLLNEWYERAVKYINKNIEDPTDKIIYHHYDLKSERNKTKFYKQFYDKSCPFIVKTNLFSFIPSFREKNKYNISLQNGVIRTNCVDCLDRTNVFQQIIGIAVLVIQLRHIGVDATFPENENEDIYGVLSDLYKKMGHELSVQYAGSLALKQSIKDHRNIANKTIDSVCEIFIACKRFVNNFFNDQSKQNAMDLFLGKYKINSGLPFIWEMPNDEILHKKKNLKDLNKYWYKKCNDDFIKYNLFFDIDRNKKIQNNQKIVIIDTNETSYSLNNIDFDTLSIEYPKIFKVSTTSLLIYKNFSALPNKSIDENFIDVVKNFKPNLNMHRKQFKNHPHFMNNINEYVFDYDLYIKYKTRLRTRDAEESAFEEEANKLYLLELKKKLEIRNFNDFIYYPIEFNKKTNNNKDIPKIRISRDSKNSNSNNKESNTSQNNYNNINIRSKENSNEVGIKRELTMSFNSTRGKNNNNKNSILPNNNPNYFNHHNNLNSYIKSPQIIRVDDPKLPSKLCSLSCVESENMSPIKTKATFKYKTKRFKDIFVHYTNCFNYNEPRTVDDILKDMNKLDICSFEFNEDDIDKINTFINYDVTHEKNKDFYDLNSFNTVDLETCPGVLENNINYKEELYDFNDPFKITLIDEKKKLNKEIKNSHNDYLILDVEHNSFYKKTPGFVPKKNTLVKLQDYYNIKNGEDEEKKNEKKEDKEENNTEPTELEGNNEIKSPKTKVNGIKNIPLNIVEDFYAIKI